MKKALLLFVGCLLISSFLLAQAPKLFNYQGIAHGALGPIVNQAVGIKISIIDQTTNGVVLYSERHADTTNTFGLYTIAIGSGTALNGKMDSVDWSTGDKYIKVEIDPIGGTNYTDLGTTQLLSVPYALFAENVAADTLAWSTNGNKVNNTAFIGTLNDEDIRFKRNSHPIGVIESKNVAFGENAFISNTFGVGNFAVGDSALYSNQAGKDNTALGSKALKNNRHGNSNNAFGKNALYSNTIGYNNNAIGANTLYNNTQGGLNNAFGVNALFKNTTGFSNNAIGNDALYNNISGNFNNALGNYSLHSNTTGFANSAFGGFSLRYNTTGDNNNAVGKYALNHNTTGDDNNAIGFNAGFTNTIGSYLTIIGSSADVNDTNYTKSGAFGYQSTITASNQYRIGAPTNTSSIGGRVGWTTVSDARFKTNVKENVAGLAFIEQLRPVTYNLDDQKIENFIGIDRKVDEKVMSQENSTQPTEVFSGFIAQEVETTAEKLGYNFHGVDKPKNDKDYYGLRYAEFVVPLVKAVQELNKIGEEKEAKIIDLQRQIDELKAMILSK